MIGNTEHEAEIFVRLIFDNPINGLTYKAAFKLLFLDSDVSDKVLALYPPNCEKDVIVESDSSRLSSEECKAKICSLGFLSDICANPVADNLLDGLCEGIIENKCLSDDYDDRQTLEPPGMVENIFYY